MTALGVLVSLQYNGHLILPFFLTKAPASAAQMRLNCRASERLFQGTQCLSRTRVEPVAYSPRHRLAAIADRTPCLTILDEKVVYRQQTGACASGHRYG